MRKPHNLTFTIFKNQAFSLDSLEAQGHLFSKHYPFHRLPNTWRPPKFSLHSNLYQKHLYQLEQNPS